VIVAAGNVTMSGNFTYTGANATELWGEDMGAYSDPTTFGGLIYSVFGGDNMATTAALIINIVVALVLLILAWKTKGWLRILLSICAVIWGIFYMGTDIKIAAPLLAAGFVLFIQGIIAQIQSAREQAE